MQNDFDIAALESYLATEFGGAPLSLQRISGGQSNPTYFLTHGARRMVLRKQPNGPILRGAHAVDREYRVLEALADSPVPVPKMILFSDDTSLIGTPFYLMERVEGRVFSDCALPDCQPEERRALYLSMAETLAQLHAVRPDDIGLQDYGRPGNYFARQIARWTQQWHDSDSNPIPDLDTLSAWLTENIPPEDGHVSIAHGDFRLGNMLFHPTEPRVVAVLDWELSTLGHPLADLGFCVMPWRTSPDEYGGILGSNIDGIPAEETFIAAYQKHAETAPPLQPFHVAFALFRFAVIFVGIADRARMGSAASTEAAALGPLAARFAARGLNVIKR